MSNDNWAIMRQVVIGAEDLETTGKEMREAFGLAPGFADPLLDEMGLGDETFRVGPEAHLEVVAPIAPTAGINGWLTKGGGGGGYALSIQVPDIEPHLAAAKELGIRVVADVVAYDRRIVQLHPGDMGLLVELDEIPEPEQWFWDDVEAEVSEKPAIDDVLAVDVASPDPAAQAEQWSAVLLADLEGASLKLGTRTVRFVEGERKMLSAIDVAATEHGADLPAEQTISGVTFRTVR